MKDYKTKRLEELKEMIENTFILRDKEVLSEYQVKLASKVIVDEFSKILDQVREEAMDEAFGIALKALQDILPED